MRSKRFNCCRNWENHPRARIGACRCSRDQSRGRDGARSDPRGESSGRGDKDVDSVRERLRRERGTHRRRLHSIKAPGRRRLIPYITAGDPDLATTEQLLIELAHAGATVIELGVPFSDPMADGPGDPTRSNARLKTRSVCRDLLDMAARARKQIDTPDHSLQLFQSVASVWCKAPGPNSE